MSNATQYELAKCVVRLHGQSGQAWELFMAALKAHADEQRNICVQSPQETLQVNQGRAQGVIALHKLFTEAPDVVAQIERRK